MGLELEPEPELEPSGLLDLLEVCFLNRALALPNELVENMEAVSEEAGWAFSTSTAVLSCGWLMVSCCA